MVSNGLGQAPDSALKAWHYGQRCRSGPVFPNVIEQYAISVSRRGRVLVHRCTCGLLDALYADTITVVDAGDLIQARAKAIDLAADVEGKVGACGWCLKPVEGVPLQDDTAPPAPETTLAARQGRGPRAA
jgi:hypothetical protein